MCSLKHEQQNHCDCTTVYYSSLRAAFCIYIILNRKYYFVSEILFKKVYFVFQIIYKKCFVFKYILMYHILHSRTTAVSMSAHY